MIHRTAWRSREMAVNATTITVATGLLGQLVLVASGVFAARLLGAHDRGYLALLVLAPAALAQLGPLGLPVATTYYVAQRPQDARAILHRLAPVCISQAALLMAVHAGLLVVMSHVVGLPLAPALVSLGFIPSSLAQQYGLAVLQGRQAFKSFNCLRLLPGAFYALGLTVLEVEGHGSLIVVTAIWVGAAFIASVATVVATARVLPAQRGGAPKLREMFRFGARALIDASSPVDAFRADQAVVGLFLSPTVLGLYVVALAFTNLPRFIGQSIGMVAYPRIAAARAHVRREITKYVALVIVTAGAAVLVLEALMPRIVPLFFGSQFAGASPLARIILLASFLVAIRRVLADCLRGAGRPGVGSIAEISSWIVLFPVLAPLAALWGAEGVAFALLLAAAVSLVVLASFALGYGRAAQMSPATSLAQSLVRSISFLVLLAGVGAATPFVSWKFGLLVGIGLTLIGALMVRRVRMGPLDLFDPLSLFVIAWAIMFIARPAVMAAYGDFTLLHYETRTGFTKMLVLALLGALGFIGGYFSRLPANWASRRRPLPNTPSDSIAVPYALAVLCGGLVLFALFLGNAGGAGALKTLVSGRSQALADLWQNSSAYLSGALMLAFPAALLLVDVGLRRRDRLLIGGGILALLPAVAPGVLTGTRSSFLPVIAALWMLPYLRRGTRPRRKAVIVVAFLAFTVGITFVGATRDLPARQHGLIGPLKSSLFRPDEGARRLLETGDTEMAPLLAIMISNVPDRFPYMDGAATGELFVHWVPRALWPGKPRQGDEVLTRKLFHDTGISQAPRQFSPLANFYLDLGLLGGFVGMAFIGMLARAHYEYFRRHFRQSSVQLFYAATFPFWINLFRGNLTATAGGLVFVIPPLILGMYLARGHAPRRKRTRELAAAGRGA
jgi:O-antigen/teichoic acid export membrane protein